MFGNIELKKAPQGYVPNCETVHDEVGRVMRQQFKGGKVRFNYDKTTGTAEAIVDNRVVGRWNDLTVGMWGDVLYTLETEFKDKITQ